MTAKIIPLRDLPVIPFGEHEGLAPRSGWVLLALLVANVAMLASVVWSLISLWRLL